MKKIFFIALICLSITADAQQKIKTDLLHLNSPCPEFTLSDVQYFKQKSANLYDFKGQWLILDFWNQTCTVCLNSMPKINQLQAADYKDPLQIIMVGYTGSKYHAGLSKKDDKSIRKLYKMNRKMNDLKLTVAFDSLLFDRFDIAPCPYVVVINPEGIVKAITTHIEKKQIDSLQNNQSVHLQRAFTNTETMRMRK